MPPDSSPWLALQRELFAVSLDSNTNRESRRYFLARGTLVEDPLAAVRRAKASGLDAVVLRVLSRVGEGDLVRVATESLCGALPKVR